MTTGAKPFNSAELNDPNVNRVHCGAKAAAGEGVRKMIARDLENIVVSIGM